MTEKELKDHIKDPSGGYFFYGDEDYLKEHYLTQIRRAVITDESLADFNLINLDDENFSPSALSDALASPPLMSEKKLIIVKLSSYNSIPDKDKKEILDLLSDIPSDTVTVFSIAPDGFDPGTEKRPTAAYKALSAVLNTVDFPLGTEPKLIRWLARHFSQRGVASDEASLRLMISLCGRSMHRLSGEAEKVASRVLAMGMNAVTPHIIETTVTVTPEEEAFRLSNAILEGNTEAALDTLARAKRRNESAVKMLAAVTAVFSDLAVIANLAAEGLDRKEIASTIKMHEYRVGIYLKASAGVPLEMVNEAVSLCADADAQMKSSQHGYVPLERLICSVKLH